MRGRQRIPWEDDTGMGILIDLLLVTVGGFLAGHIASRFGLPRLAGMIVVGIIAGPPGLGLLSPAITDLSGDIRMLALMVILIKAGLGLDRKKILDHGSVALRLGFVPALIEASVVAVTARWILGWEWIYCWLLGWILSAESPAVIVPMMLHLKSRGLGSSRGVPDLVLAGGALSDVTAVTIFGITLAWVTGTSNGVVQVGIIPIEIVGGLLLGFIAGKAAHWLVHGTSLTSSSSEGVILVGGLAIALMASGQVLPFSALLAVIVMGLVIVETDPVLARRLRSEFDRIWVVAQIFLFVLIGAALNLAVVPDVGLRGLGVIVAGLALGRFVGVAASTLGSRITVPERMFMMIATVPKATVQAAIGAIPLTLGLAYGPEILAIAVLSILATAPLGAMMIALWGPRLLERGPVDLSRTTSSGSQRFLVAMDGSPSSQLALERAALAARHSDADMLVLHVADSDDPPALEAIKNSLVPIGDVPHRFLLERGSPAQAIVETASNRGVDYIFMGKQNRKGLDRVLIGDVAREVIHNTDIPVILVGDNGHGSAGVTDQ